MANTHNHSLAIYTTRGNTLLARHMVIIIMQGGTQLAIIIGNLAINMAQGITLLAQAFNNHYRAKRYSARH